MRIQLIQFIWFACLITLVNTQSSRSVTIRLSNNTQSQNLNPNINQNLQSIRTISNFDTLQILTPVVTQQSLAPNPQTTPVSNPILTPILAPISAPISSSLQNIPSNQITAPISSSQISFPLTIPPSAKDMKSYLKAAELTWSLLRKQICKNGPILTDVAIRQHNTSFYLTAHQYYLYFNSSGMPRPIYIQFLTAYQNGDCSWSFQTRDGLYISLNPNYNYLMLTEKIGDYQKFRLIQKKDYLTVQSAFTGIHYWTAVNGIARLALKQASRFIIELWALPS